MEWGSKLVSGTKKKSLSEKLGSAIGRWALDVEEEDGEEIRSIWLGTQEPSHTVGFLSDGNGGFIKNTEEKRKNIELYLDTWKNTANTLSEQGFKVGGLQLNGSNVDDYDYTLSLMRAKNISMDYFSIQQYRAEENNEQMLSTVKSSLIITVTPGETHF